MNRIFLNIVLLSALFVIGCDFDLTGNKARMRKMQEERREAERREYELKSFRNSMKSYVSSLISLKEGHLKECSRQIEPLRIDAERLTKVINTIMTTKTNDGKELSYETKVLNAMRDADVNALSKKYLSVEFTSLTSGYIEQVRDAMASEARYRKAVQDVDVMYNEVIAETKKWRTATKEQRQSEISRLKGEVNRLTRNKDVILNDIRDMTKNKLVIGGRRYAREQNEKGYTLQNKLYEIDGELNKKRRQIDILTNPEELQRLAMRTSYDIQYQQDQAVRLRRNAMYDIDNRLKPEIEVREIASDFENRTIVKLREELAKRIAEKEKELEGINNKIRLAKEIILQIPIASMEELGKLKKKLQD